MIGYPVVLVEKSVFPRQHIGESLPGSILPLLEALQIRSRIEDEGFLRTKAVLICWADAPEVRQIDGPPGFQVDRSCFDMIMLQASKDAGAQVFQPAHAIHIARNSRERWSMVISHVDGNHVYVDCDFLIDASGRSAALGGRRSLIGAPTLALYAYWKCTALEGPETRVEAGVAEWFWGAPLPQGLFNATVLIDRSRYKEGVDDAGSTERFYDQLIGSSELLRFCLTGIRTSRVKVCDATCHSDDLPIVNGLIKVGEAAFTIDPLSSQGVQTAIGCGLHGAAVVHTMLVRPENTAIAQQFYLERQRRSVEFHRRAAGSMYANALRKFPTDFWSRRSSDGCDQVEEPERLVPMELSPGA